MAVRLRTGEGWPVVTVDGHHGSLERVAHVADPGDPTHVRRNGRKIHEETREEQEGDAGRRTGKHGHLFIKKKLPGIINSLIEEGYLKMYVSMNKKMRE